MTTLRFPRPSRPGLAAVAALALSGCAAGRPAATPVTLAGAGPGVIGFDDLVYSASLDRLLVPAGRTGSVYLLSPGTGNALSLRAFPPSSGAAKGHDVGVTSADAGLGLVFAVDRNARVLRALDPQSGKVKSSVALAGKPDYVRYVEATREVWVTEPALHEIEVFSVGRGKSSAILKHSGSIRVPDGPESLVVDSPRRTAFTNSRGGASLALSVGKRRIKARWKNGCGHSSGLALDEDDGFLFVGCREGKAQALDTIHQGKVLSSVAAGAGVDIIAYDPALRHLYVPGAESATLVIADVGSRGALDALETVRTAPEAHCVVARARRFWVCDPRNARLLRFDDR